MGKVEEDAAFVVRSSHRTTVLRRLMKGNAIPSQIRDDTGLEYSRITEAVKPLRDRGLVELVVPDDTKRGRLYALTERGEDTWEYMVENGMVDG
ncbi:MAG: ArsR family transcriptional regulator [Halobacteriales archaeon]